MNTKNISSPNSDKAELPKVKRVKASKLAQKPKNASKNIKDEALAKYRKMQKQKMADLLSCDTRVSHIKSAGNGI